MITAAEVIHALERHVYQAVQPAHGERIALACCKALVKCLWLNFRRQYLYIPLAHTAELHKRNEAIWAAFNGRNHSELALKYRMSLQHIYAIVKTMRRASADKYQAQLFPLPGEEDERPLLLVVLEDYLPADLEAAGLPGDAAAILSGDIARFMVEHYRGIQIKITDAIYERRSGDNGDLFCEAI